jgi:hypothetical protein
MVVARLSPLSAQVIRLGTPWGGVHGPEATRGCGAGVAEWDRWGPRAAANPAADSEKSLVRHMARVFLCDAVTRRRQQKMPT